MQGLGRPGKELIVIVAAGCFKLAGLFVSSLQKEANDPVLTTVEAQLSLHKGNIVKAAPETQEWQETGG